MTKIVDIREKRIGKVDQLYKHGDTDEPNWASVKFGVIGFRTRFVPLQDAQHTDDQIRVPYERDHVKVAPKIDPDGDCLTDDEAELLHRHYGLERVVGITSEDSDIDTDLPRETREAEPPGMDDGPDNPLNKRRRKRAKELGVPQHN